MSKEKGGGSSVPSTGYLKFISFKLKDEIFGIEITHVKEILKKPDITPIPRAPEYLLGIMNLRGSILPVIDLSKRLEISQTDSEITEKTRVLVVNIGGEISGIMVDEVEEVQTVDKSKMEPPPELTSGIDRFFIEGVVKIGETKELVMILDLEEVLKIVISSSSRLAVTTAGSVSDTAAKKEMVSEDQVVTFFLEDEEYGIDILSIKEILKTAEMTSVPNVPDYVVGIQNIRDSVLPIIDMREIVSMEKIEDSYTELFTVLTEAFAQQIRYVGEIISKGDPDRVMTTSEVDRAGKLLQQQVLNNPLFSDSWAELSKFHREIETIIGETLTCLPHDKQQALETYKTRLEPAQSGLDKLLAEVESRFFTRIKRDQRVLIIEIDQTTIGLLVDRVSEVLRIPKNHIDTTPSIIASYGKEVKGIAKLNEGSRLILILNERSIISRDDAQVISKINEEKEAEKEVIEKIEELQYAVFSIYGEEFGVNIDKVQEIFKVKEITMIPKAPDFIKGITNLRGNIIPIIDIRQRFGLNDAVSEYRELLSNLLKIFKDQIREIEERIKQDDFKELDSKLTQGGVINFFESYNTLNENIFSGLSSIRNHYDELEQQFKDCFNLLKEDPVKGKISFQELKKNQISTFSARLKETIGKKDLNFEKNEKILVVLIEKLTIGLLVDSVHEVPRIPRNLIEEAPSLVTSNISTNYIEGIAKLENGKRIILLLSLKDIMSEEDYLKLKGLHASDFSEDPSIEDTQEKPGERSKVKRSRKRLKIIE